MLATTVVFLLLAGQTTAQQGGNQPAAGTAVPKSGAAQAGAAIKDAATPEEHPAKVVGNFGQWALICVEAKTQGEKPSCSLVQALIEKESKKLVFRVCLAYGPKGNLVLRIDGPTGVALQKGLEFSPDAVKIYRLPFQTCLPRGCTALLLVEDDLKQDLQKSEKGTIAVHALSGQEVKGRPS